MTMTTDSAATAGDGEGWHNRNGITAKGIGKRVYLVYPPEPWEETYRACYVAAVYGLVYGPRYATLTAAQEACTRHAETGEWGGGEK